MHWLTVLNINDHRGRILKLEDQRQCKKMEEGNNEKINKNPQLQNNINSKLVDIGLKINQK